MEAGSPPPSFEQQVLVTVAVGAAWNQVFDGVADLLAHALGLVGCGAAGALHIFFGTVCRVAGLVIDYVAVVVTIVIGRHLGLSFPIVGHLDYPSDVDDKLARTGDSPFNARGVDYETAICIGSPSINRVEITFASVATANAAAPCTATCFVDATGGNDTNDGDSAATAKKTIQAAINAVHAGAEVRVMPGNYDETATNSMPTTIIGPYAAGQTVSNAVLVPVSATGTVCFFSMVPTDLVVDLSGWFSTQLTG